MIIKAFPVRLACGAADWPLLASAHLVIEIGLERLGSDIRAADRIERIFQAVAHSPVIHGLAPTPSAQYATGSSARR
jgi:hypothetical protein